MSERLYLSFRPLPHLVDFSQPFLQQDFTFLVPAGSAIRSAAVVDRPEVRVAVVRNHGSTLALARILKQAKMVSADTLDGAFALLRDGQADAFASTRPQLIDNSERLPGSVVLDDRYGVNFSVLAIAKNRSGRLAYVNEFIQEANYWACCSAPSSSMRDGAEFKWCLHSTSSP